MPIRPGEPNLLSSAQESRREADIRMMESETPEAGVDAGADHLDELIEAVEQELERARGEALERAEEAVAGARQARSRLHEGKALHLRGWAHFWTGDIGGAIEDQLAAMDLSRAVGDEPGVGRCLHALGAIYETIGEPTVAVEHFEQAMEIQRRVGDKWGEARTRNGLAITMTQESRYLEAAAAFLDVAERFAEVGDGWWVLIARVNRAYSLLDHVETAELPTAEAADRYKEIVAECDRAIEQAADLGSAGSSVVIHARECRAGALRGLGDAAASLQEVEETLPMATVSEDVTAIVGLEMHAARALEALGRPELVLDRLNRAEEMARTSGRDRQLTQCLELRANICEARGDLAGALEAHREYHSQKVRARRSAEEMRATVIRALLDTQRAKHELELARAEVESLEAIGQERRRMISIIAHELRNPITTVLGLSDEMSRNWDRLGDDGRQLITMIRDEADDLANIVEDLLVAERIEDGSLQVAPEDCDLLKLSLAVVEAVSLQGKSISVQGASPAYADPARVRQILRNLVTNAVRYGGDDIVVDIAANESVASLEVRDNGGGVPEEDRETIFEPYGRSEGVGHRPGSVGLGLAVTRLLARLMGGDVAYDEVPETVFRLTLPLAEPSPA